MAESVEVLFQIIYGLRCLTDWQIKNEPHLADFVKRFRSSFIRDDVRCVYVFDPIN